jgi:hypothetical protein
MKKLLLTLAAGVAAIGATSSANATSILEITGISVLSGSPSGTIRNNGTNYSARLGPQQITGKLDGVDTSLIAYCLELTQTSGLGTFEVVSLKDYLSGFYSASSAQTRTNLISSVLGNNGGSGNLLTEVALQLAIWELRYENLNDVFDLKDDRFKLVSNGLSSYVNAANSLYANSGELLGGTYDFFVAKNEGHYEGKGHKKKWVEGKQDLLFYTFTPFAAPVPEPATWAMMIGGFALAGAAMRRRKPVVSFA